MKDSGDRYCIIQEEGGPVTIKFFVDENLMAGGDFQLIDPQKNITKEHWKMSAENGNFASKRLTGDPLSMHLHTVNWDVLVCSKSPATYEGVVSIALTQAGKNLNLTVSAEYELDNVPPCKVSQTTDFAGKLTFITKRKTEGPKF